MKLRDKLRYLREVEGSLRGLDRPLTQAEVVRALTKEHKKGISQAYFSQIESGKRPHMTNDTRALLAKFFKVHPGFLVDDPDGFHTELTSDLRTTEGRLDIWLLQGADHFRNDPDVAEVMVKMARHPDTRSCFLLNGAILDTPGLAERLLEALGPQNNAPQKSSPQRGLSENITKPDTKARAAAGKKRTR
jgi:transcriptional regulator with XRE-family HTH domain